MPTSGKNTPRQSNGARSRAKDVNGTDTMGKGSKSKPCAPSRPGNPGGGDRMFEPDFKRTKYGQPSQSALSLLTMCFLVGAVVAVMAVLWQVHVRMDISHKLYDKLDRMLEENKEMSEKAIHKNFELFVEELQEHGNTIEVERSNFYEQFGKRLIENEENQVNENQKLFDKVENNSDKVRKTFRREMHRFIANLPKMSEEIVVKFEKAFIKGISDRLETSLNGFLEKLNELSNEIDKKLDDSSTEISDKVDKSSEEIDGRLETSFKGIHGKLDKLSKHNCNKNEDSSKEIDVTRERDKHTRETYDRRNVTNDADYQIRDLLDQGEAILDEGSLEEAQKYFDAVTTLHPESSRGLWGKARVIQRLAKQHSTKNYTGEAIRLLTKICFLPDLKDAIFTPALKMLYEMQRSNNTSKKDMYTVWKKLYDRYPDAIEIQRIFGPILKDNGHQEMAIKVLHQVVDRDPSDAVSSARLGTLYHKHLDDSLSCVKYLQHAIDVGFPQGHFAKIHYYDLTICYNRLNDTKRELEIADKAVEKGYMISRDQRSSYNCDPRLPTRPFWTIEETTYQEHLNRLEVNWETVREEALKLFDNHTGLFREQREGLTDKGDWRYLIFYRNGVRYKDGCKLAPKTCALFDNFPAATGCTCGQIKLSIMQPGVHVWPHSGPTNCRIRSHLGLVVPRGPRIKVANETRTWQEGKMLIFDDSFLHEVWHDGDTFRMVLIVDFWHPNLSQQERDKVKISKS